MSQVDLSLDEAIEQYLGATTHLNAKTLYQYRGTLNKLRAAFPNSRLAEFEPPEGTDRLTSVLEARWGGSAPRTFNRNLSTVHKFFEWQVQQGNLGDDPAKAIGRIRFEVESRSVYSDEERECILQANEDPRDAVALRLLFFKGIENAALRRLRFGDFDVARHELTIAGRGGRSRTMQVEDTTLWEKFVELRRLRCAEDDDYVMALATPRKYDPTAEELAAMETNGMLDGGRRYLWTNHAGRWQRTTFDPKKPRQEHGIQKWWYRCLWRAGIVAPGVEVGEPMSKARLTLGQALYAESGMKEVRRVLGIVSRSSTHSNVFTNRDADQLDVTLRRVRHQYRPLSSANAPDAWWKSPIKRLADYVEEERDLVELSRISIEMLRTQDANSHPLRDAAATLIRVVKPTKLIERARQESEGDHPQLHGHSLVAIWGAMETMTIDVVAAWLENWPAARQYPSVADIKVSLATFETMSAAERIDLLVQELDQKRSGSRGIARFDRLLDAVGLSGSHSSQLAKNIYEMQQIRNVFAHKSGVADGRFVDACPHLGYRVGQPIAIDRHTWSDFLVNALLYAELVLKRAKAQFGVPFTTDAPLARPIRYVAPRNSS